MCDSIIFKYKKILGRIYCHSFPSSSSAGSNDDDDDVSLFFLVCTVHHFSTTTAIDGGHIIIIITQNACFCLPYTHISFYSIAIQFKKKYNCH